MIRKLLETLGLVRAEHDDSTRYAETDAVVKAGKQAAKDARLRRLREEDESFRRAHQ